MPPVFKRRVGFLDDHCGKRKTNEIIVPDRSENVEKAWQRLNGITEEILENTREVCRSFQDYKADTQEKEEDIRKKITSLKILDKEIFNLTTVNTNLVVNIKAVENANEEIGKENLQLEQSVTLLQDEAALVEKDKVIQREKIIKRFKTILMVYNMYKIHTGCKLRCEEGNIIVLEFSPDVYVKLFSEDMKKNWMIIDIKPDLNNRNDLEKKLMETDNVQGLVASLHETLSPYFY